MYIETVHVLKPNLWFVPCIGNGVDGSHYGGDFTTTDGWYGSITTADPFVHRGRPGIDDQILINDESSKQSCGHVVLPSSATMSREVREEVTLFIDEIILICPLQLVDKKLRSR